MSKYGKLQAIEEIDLEDEHNQVLKLQFKDSTVMQTRLWPELADGKSLRDHLWDNSDFITMLTEEPDVALMLIDILSRRIEGPNLRYQDVATEEFKAEGAKILSSEVLYEGWFKLLRLKLQYQRFDGEWSEPHEHVGMFGGCGVSVLLYDPDTEEVVLIEEFRQGRVFTTSPFMLGLPGGGIDSGESVEAAALREVKEEAGVSVYALRHLLSFYSAPGFSDNLCHAYLGLVDASKAGGTHGLKHENENIRVKVLRFDDALAMISEGKITNGPAITALTYFALHRESIMNERRDIAVEAITESNGNYVYHVSSELYNDIRALEYQPGKSKSGYNEKMMDVDRYFREVNAFPGPVTAAQVAMLRRAGFKNWGDGKLYVYKINLHENSAAINHVSVTSTPEQAEYDKKHWPIFDNQFQGVSDAVYGERKREYFEQRAKYLSSLGIKSTLTIDEYAQLLASKDWTQLDKYFLLNSKKGNKLQYASYIPHVQIDTRGPLTYESYEVIE